MTSRPRSPSHERLRAEAARLGLEIVAMPLTFELPDGGRVEVTDPAIVPMGDVFAYRQLTYSRSGEDDRPGCKIVFEVRGEVPACVSISLSAEGQNQLRASDLKSINPVNLRDDVYAHTGVFVQNADGGDGEYVRRLGWAPFLEDRKRVENAAKRRKLTPEFLGRVANVHKAASDGGRLAAIKDAFGVDNRQALRYIAKAKEKGLIDE
jgi:hypothetical protein